MRRLSIFALLFLFIGAVSAVFYVTADNDRLPNGTLRLHGWVEGTDVS